MASIDSFADVQNGFCCHCRDLQDRGFNWLLMQPDLFRQASPNRPSFPHHSTFADLAAAASHECHLCALLLRAMLHCPEPNCECTEAWSTNTMPEHNLLDIDESHPFEVALEWKYPVRHLDKSWRCVALQYRRPGMEHPHIGPFRVRDFTGGYLVRLSIRSINPGKHAFAYRQVSLLPDFELARQWLTACTLHHKNCHGMANEVMPTRLIHVGRAKEEPRLVEVRGHCSQYIALSHCWGEAQPLRTTVLTYGTHLSSIPLRTMPRTFQDAVVVTRRLGFCYVWIDSLCIVQDNIADWETECAIMSDIYANASVTIAGPAASNADAGFLHGRIPMEGHSCELNVSSESGRSPDSTFILSSNENHEWNWSRGEINSPLDLRGWTLQEYVLSPRKLFFASKQIYYICNMAYSFEAFHFSEKPLHSATPLNAGNVWSVSSDVTDWEQGTWNGLITKFSERKLSHGSDVLPALSGLALRYHKITGDQYLAGLWRRTLARDLLWTPSYRNEKREQSRRSIHDARHPLPSWSWAACELPIFFLGPQRGDRAEWCFVPDLEVLEASANPAGFDHFGEVSATCLRMRARIWTYMVNHTLQEKSSRACLTPTSAESPLIHEFLPDEVADNQERDQVHETDVPYVQCALLTWRPSLLPGHYPIELWSLALKKVANEHIVYHRVGLAKIHIDSNICSLDSIEQSIGIFPGGELTDLTIV